MNLKADPKLTVTTATLTLNATATVNGTPFAHPTLTVNGVVKK